jgi:hypothetical protein
MGQSVIKAVQARDVEAVKKIINRAKEKGDESREAQEVDQLGRSALHYAAKIGLVEVWADFLCSRTFRSTNSSNVDCAVPTGKQV